MNWIKVEDELPEENLSVFIAYADEDRKNPGISKGFIQNFKWYADFLSERGEDFDEEYSKVSHWAYINDILKYPDE